MLLIVASPKGLADTKQIDKEVVHALRTMAKAHAVGIVSNHAEPEWFSEHFGGSKVQFRQARGRQNGQFIAGSADNFGLAAHDVLVLAANHDDLRMGKNGGAVVVAAGWSTDDGIKDLGISVSSARELREVVRLSDGWSGGWYFRSEGDFYNVRSLGNLSGINQPDAQAEFAKRLTRTVKDAGPALNSLLVVTARSLLKNGVGDESGLVWGVYPSSQRNDEDSEVLSDFTHRLRTTVSQVHYAKRGKPLFIRHRDSAKRSHGHGPADRTDPSDQVESIHLNPYYREKNRLRDRHIIVVDDCTTYGASFGVAASLLKAAGARKVTGVALGKFGHQLREYDIQIDSDPFAPIGATDYEVKSIRLAAGDTSPDAQDVLRDLLS